MGNRINLYLGLSRKVDKGAERRRLQRHSRGKCCEQCMFDNFVAGFDSLLCYVELRNTIYNGTQWRRICSGHIFTSRFDCSEYLQAFESVT